MPEEQEDNDDQEDAEENPEEEEDLPVVGRRRKMPKALPHQEKRQRVVQYYRRGECQTYRSTHPILDILSVLIKFRAMLLLLPLLSCPSLRASSAATAESPWI